VADAHRDQRGADEAAQHEGAAAVSLDEPAREDELPASERFADDSPDPEQVYVGTELREMINENLEELSPLLKSAFVLREVQAIRPAKPRRRSA